MDTATEKKVVEERRVKSPLSNNKSHPGDVYFTRIVELVYDDGSSEFCDTERKFFADSAAKIRGQLSAETRKTNPKKVMESSDPDTVLGRLQGIVAEKNVAEKKLHSAERRCEAWKLRAVSAEKELAEIKRLLGMKLK
jgi:hypothetical protein